MRRRPSWRMPHEVVRQRPRSARTDDGHRAGPQNGGAGGWSRSRWGGGWGWRLEIGWRGWKLLQVYICWMFFCIIFDLVSIELMESQHALCACCDVIVSLFLMVNVSWYVSMMIRWSLYMAASVDMNTASCVRARVPNLRRMTPFPWIFASRSVMM